MTGLDPAPFTRRQLAAIGAGARRELRYGLWQVRRELNAWRSRVAAIDDPKTRAAVLAAMDDGRALVDGAALFWTLTQERNDGLLRLLVALQTLLNLTDHALERDARESDGRPGSWTRLVGQALDVTRRPPTSAEAMMFAGSDGFVRELVGVCRAVCPTLLGYQRGRDLLVQEAQRATSFEIEHDPDADRRLSDMKFYAVRHFPQERELLPWELVGGASSLMTAMAVLALAADGAPTRDLLAAVDTYVLVGSAAALLDSYGDQWADAQTGAHNWYMYYKARDVAVERTALLLREAVMRAAAMRHGERHVVLVACMAALALSSDAARGSALRPTTKRIASRAGTTTRLMVPVLRTWRLVHGLSSA